MATDQRTSPSPLLLLLLSLLIGPAAALASRRHWPFQRCFSSHRCYFSLSLVYVFSFTVKIMIPCIVLAGPIGLGFGYMSAEGNNILPSVSLVFSSMLIIAGCFTYAFARQLNAFQTGDMLFGGILISCGASLGVFLQWVIQFFSLLLPATINLAFVHIASFTNLCFSSLILSATAGLSYKESAAHCHF